MNYRPRASTLYQGVLAAAALFVLVYYYLHASIFHPTAPYLLLLMLLVVYWFQLKGRIASLPSSMMRLPRWALVIMSLALVLITEYGIAQYYDVLDALNISFIRRLYYVLLEVGSVYALFFLTLYLLGDLLLIRWLKLSGFSAFVARTAIGLFGLSMYGYALAGIGQLQIRWYIALFIVLCIVRFPVVVRLVWSLFRERVVVHLNGKEFYLTAIFFGICILYFSFILFNAYTRFHIDTDVLRAYQYVPRVYVETGALVDFPYDYALHTAKGAEMLYVPFMFFKPYLVNYFMPMTLLLIAFVLYRLVSEYFGSRWAIFSVLAFLATPVTYTFTRTLKVDLFLVLIVLCALYLGMRWWRERDRRYLITAAVIVGFAVTVKYTILALFPSIGILLLISAGGVGPWASRIAGGVRRCFLFFLLVFLAASPWLVRNYILYDDPFHPFLKGRAYVVDAYIAETGIEQPGYTGEWSQQIMTVGFDVGGKSRSQLFFEALAGLSPRSFGAIGPWYLALLVLSLFVFRRVRSYYLIVAMTLAAWFHWALFQAWYFFYLLPIMLLAGIHSLRQFVPSLRKFFIVIFVFFFFWGMQSQLKAVTYSYEFWIGKANINEDYFIEGSQLKQASNFINTTLLASDPQYKMYAINFYPSFFIRDAYRHLIVEPDHFSISYIYNVNNEVNDIKAFLQKKGIRYLFLSYPFYAKRLHEIDSYAAYPIVQQDIRMIDELLRSSHFIYANDLFYVVDLSQPSPDV
ncbi:MAG: glycosyltransferase family 39 protein [Patescibacteria group bacterium]